MPGKNSDTRYTKDHEWARLDGDIVTIGITDYAQQQLGELVFIELPELERRLKQGILDAIGPHIAKFVEEPLRARLDAHLQHALTALSAQVKTDIEAMIRDAVARAVELEIARARGPSRGS